MRRLQGTTIALLPQRRERMETALISIGSSRHPSEALRAGIGPTVDPTSALRDQRMAQLFYRHRPPTSAFLNAKRSPSLRYGSQGPRPSLNLQDAASALWWALEGSARCGKGQAEWS